MARSPYRLVASDPYWGNELPAAEDPIWAQFGDVVLDTLEEPMTVNALKRWARKEKFSISKLYNTLAWLDMRGLVLLDKTSEPEPIWKRADVEFNEKFELVQYKSLAPVPKQCSRCAGLMKVESTRIACIACGHSIYPPPDLAEPDDDLSFP